MVSTKLFATFIGRDWVVEQEEELGEEMVIEKLLIMLSESESESEKKSCITAQERQTSLLVPVLDRAASKGDQASV